MSSIILLSGGLDSTVSAYIAKPSMALTFDYGQNSFAQEKAAAFRTCERLGMEHKILALPWLKEIANSAIVGAAPRGRPNDVGRHRDLPLLTMNELDDPQKTEASAKSVWVPNRNGVFLNIAAAYAESLGFESIIAGFNIEEAGTFPDNSEKFVKAANQFFSFSTLKKLRVESPTQKMTKTEIVQKAVELGVNFNDIWSCYEGNDKPCAKCESCLRSIRAYKRTGIWPHVENLYSGVIANVVKQSPK